MLFYDWKKIYETCKGNTAEIVRVLKMLVEKQLPVNHYDKIYKYYHIAVSYTHLTLPTILRV